MMDEDKKEEDNGLGIGTLLTIGIVVTTLIVGMGIYVHISEPFYTADKLRDKINSMNVTDEYRQGWLDCVDEYMDIMTEPTNCTTAGFNPCDYAICNIEPLLVVVSGLGLSVGILYWWSKKPCS